MAYIRHRKPTHDHCPFCETKTEPDYKDYKTLRGFTTDKGKIISRARSGVCMSHQRAITSAVKYARELALLPYISQL